jgi:hypothetical protein
LWGVWETTTVLAGASIVVERARPLELKEGVIVNQQVFQRAVALGERWQHAWISTTDEAGTPHIASVGSFFAGENDRLILGDWSCPVTLVNLRHNPRIAIVVWDVYTDEGYQILGDVEAIVPAAPEHEIGAESLPLDEKELWVRVGKVLAFSHAPHNDVELESEAETGLAVAASTSGRESSGDLRRHPERFVYYGEVSK